MLMVIMIIITQHRLDHNNFPFEWFWGPNHGEIYG